MARKKFIIIISILIFTFIVYSDVVYLNSGEEFKGTLLKADEIEVLFRHNNSDKKIQVDDIFRIEIHRERKKNDEYFVEDIKDEYIRNVIKNAPSEKEYPEAAYVTLFEGTTVEYDENGVSKRTIRKIIKILKERGKRLSTISMSYLPSIRTADISFARTINNNKISYLNDFSIKKSSTYPYYAEYNEDISIAFTLPVVDINSIIDFEVIFQENENAGIFGRDFLRKEYFTKTEPCVEKDVKIIIPQKLDNIFFRKNQNTPELKMSKQYENGKIIYGFNKKNIKPVVQENNMPPYHTYAHRVYWGLRKTDIENQMEIIRKKLEESEKTTEEFDKFLSSIINTGMKDFEKVEKIFRYIRSEITHLNIPMASFRYYPQPAEKIFNNKRGNTLDKLNLFRVMLLKAGIKAELIYYIDGYSDYIREMPVIEDFYNIAVKVYVDGKERYLTPLSPLSNINDAWEGNTYNLNIQTGLIEYTDFVKPEYVKTDTVFDINVFSDGSAFFKVNMLFKGGAGENFRAVRFASGEELRKGMEAWVKNFHQNAEVKNYVFKNLDSTLEDVQFEVEFSVDNYASKSGHSFLMFRLPFGYSSTAVSQSERIHDFNLDGYIYQTGLNINLTIPDNMNFYSFPENMKINCHNFWGIESNTETSDNKLIMTSVFKNYRDILPESIYSYHKKYTEELARWSDEFVVLISNSQ